MTFVRTLSFAAIVALTSHATPAQTTGSEPPARFDVISVKANRSGVRATSFRFRDGRVVATNVTVRHVMWNAYGVQDFQIVGAPGWLGSDRYDLNAQAPAAPASPPQLREMLRGLLADRFNLKVHTTTQELPIYALVVAGGAGRATPKLHTASAPCNQGPGSAPAPAASQGCGFSVGSGALTGRAVTMARLTGELTAFLGRSVIDDTALAGSYDIDLEWSPDFQSDAAPGSVQQADGRPSLFTALQEQLGLRLESRRGPVAVIVVDSAERPAED